MQKNEFQPMHFHPDMEILYVIDGNLSVTIWDTSYSLGREDMILVNSGIAHEVRTEKESIFCSVTVSAKTLNEIFGQEIPVFFCCSATDESWRYWELRGLFKELIYEKVHKKHQTFLLEKSLLYRLLNCLAENFLVDGKDGDSRHTDDLRVWKMIQYVSRNFQEKVSLTELAESLYMSKSTLSRFFRRKTGIYFMDYVTKIRLQHAKSLLEYSDYTITKIAVDSGFSNSSVFSRSFREMYGTAPLKYRETKKQTLKKQQEKEQLLYAELIERNLARQATNPDAGDVKKAAVVVDVCKSTPFRKNWSKILNIGSVSNLTVANLQFHLVYLKENLHFQYARVWSVFSKKLKICDGKQKGYYNFDRLDVVFDFLMENHVKPFLDLGNRPDTTLYEPGKPVFYEEDYIPFASREIWEDFLRCFLLHLLERYGKGEVESWIFEFSSDTANAPASNYYLSSSYDYCDAFSYAWHLVKSLLPGAFVGGFMAHSDLDSEAVAEFLTACQKRRCYPDFVSFLLFPYSTVFRQGEFFSERTVQEQFELRQVARMRNILEQYGMPGCKLWITEWNNTLSNRSILNDSCFRGAYMVKTISEMADRVDLIGIWQASDWMGSYYDSVRLANGSSGLLTKDSIRKPAFFAVEFLNQLGEELLAKGENYIITKSHDDEYDILCFNYKRYGAYYFMREEKLQNPDELDHLFEDESSKMLEITLEHLPSNGSYMVRRKTINRESGSVLNEWKQFQYESHLQTADVKYIRDCCFPRMSLMRVQAKGGKLTIPVELKPHEISLFHISPDIS